MATASNASVVLNSSLNIDISAKLFPGDIQNKNNPNEFGLSNFVNREIQTLWRDTQFNAKSEQILSKLSWMSDNTDDSWMEVYSHESMYEVEDAPFDVNRPQDVIELSEDNKDDVFSHISLDKSQQNEPTPCCQQVTQDLKFERNDSFYKIQDLFEEKVDPITSPSSSAKRKQMAPRDVKPINFTSLKRKDVIFKSILRMMRRYFCTLLEANTGYNRKEKCIFTKHKQLVKCIFEGVQKLGFNEVGPNMPYYFAAFAYPNDMKKILKESKQQFRIQNDLLCQASFIVRQIDNAFNRFSKKVFEEVLAIPQISFLIQHYLKNSDELVTNPAIFETCYKILGQKTQDYTQKQSPHAEFDTNMDSMFEDFNMHSNFLSKQAKA